MRLPGHLMTGLGVALALDLPPLAAGLFVVGNVLPDRLDWLLALGWRPAWTRLHRTVTHWPPGYVGLTALSGLILPGAVSGLLLALLSGCLLHCLADACTPSGVPGLNPFDRNRRVSFRLFRNGSLPETVLPVMILILGLLRLIAISGRG